ncbi:MAG: hypothetical protein IKC71_03840 [Clostridia bacterium]|nr:hypothetical protein [Clostridia bacterium]
MLGRIARFICVFVIGIIIGIVGLGYGEYFLLAKMPISTVTSLLPNGDEYVSETLQDLSIVGVVQYVAKPDTTIGDLTTLLPIAGDAIDGLLNNEDLNDFVTIDREKVYSLTLGNIFEITDAVTVTATLNSLSSKFGFTLGELENLSIFKTTTEPITNLFTEVYGETDPNYDPNKTVYGYNQAENLLEETDITATNYTNLYQLTTLTEEDLEFVCYQNGEEYLPIFEVVSETSRKVTTLVSPLYLHKKSLADLPITTAISQIGTRLYDVKIGEFLGNTGTESGIVKAFADISIKDLSTNAEDIVNNIALADILGETDNDLLNALLVMPDGTTKVTVSTIGQRIDSLTISDVLGESDDPLIKALSTMPNGDKVTITNLEQRISTLTIGEIVGSDADGVIGAFKDLTIADLSNGGENYDKAINDIKLKDIVGSNADGLLKELLTDANGEDVTVGTIGDRLDSLTLTDILGESDDPLITALSTMPNGDPVTIKTLEQRINTLTIKDILGDTDGVLDSFEDLTINEITSGGEEYQQALKTVHLVALVGTPAPNSILESICYDDGEEVTVLGLEEHLHELKIGELIGDELTGFLVAFKDVMLLDIETNSPAYQNAVNSITLTSLLGEQKDGLLKALCYDSNGNPVTVGTIQNRINTLYLSDVVDCSQSKVLKALSDRNVLLTEIATEINNLDLAEICEVSEVFVVASITSFDGSYPLYGYDESENKFVLATTYEGTLVSGTYEITTTFTKYYKLNKTAGAWAFILYTNSAEKDILGNANYYTANSVTIGNIGSSLTGISTAFSNATVKQLVDFGILEDTVSPLLYPKTLNEALDTLG